MSKKERYGIVSFLNTFSNEDSCRKYLMEKRWPKGFICPKCASRKGYLLSNGYIQCADCRYQASVTAGTVMHRSHLPLTKWFLAFYLASQDKRGISAVQLSRQLDVTYKTAWYLLYRIRKAMGQRNQMHQLSGIVDFDDAYIGGPTVGKKRGRGTEKAKVFIAVSCSENDNPQHLCMQVTQNLKQANVKKFAKRHIREGSVIRSDDYRSYPSALKEDYMLKTQPYNPGTSQLHWLHTLVGNAKAFILGTYHGLPKDNLQSYLDEFCFRFSRRFFFGRLFDRLAFAMADSKG